MCNFIFIAISIEFVAAVQTTAKTEKILCPLWADVPWYNEEVDKLRRDHNRYDDMINKIIELHYEYESDTEKCS